MANKNPWQARMKRWAQLWPRPLADLQAQAYGVLQVAYEDVAVADAEQRRKNIHVYFTALATFTNLYASTELEARLARLETVLEAQTHGHHPTPHG